jgi:hypothetical protein
MAGKSQSRTQSSASSKASSTASNAPQVDERRKRIALRRLVDEMLAEIRAAANADNWTPAARQQAEADLARIMDQVRREAIQPIKSETARSKAKRTKPS